MKRKEYRDRQPVTISLEKDRYKDFTDLCDKERKSISLKFSEMLEEELQKNALGLGGEPNPLKLVSHITNSTEKPLQTDLTQWFSHVDQTIEQNELNKIKGQALEIVRRTDKRSMELRMNEFSRRI